MIPSSTQGGRRPSDVLVGGEREFSELNMILADVAQSPLAPVALAFLLVFCCARRPAAPLHAEPGWLS
jgi:hypothetical protein